MKKQLGLPTLFLYLKIECSTFKRGLDEPNEDTYSQYNQESVAPHEISWNWRNVITFTSRRKSRLSNFEVTLIWTIFSKSNSKSCVMGPDRGYFEI